MTQQDILKTVYGFEELRESQAVIIDAINTGRDVLALLPTGGGKSLCYQLPVLLSEGKALVITPLVSLMEDQVAELKRLRIKAACIHSYLDIREKYMIMNNLQEFQFIFCSPEWLATEKARQILPQLNFSHFIIDEAHCISEWGFDFRPHYLILHEILRDDRQVIALTATADEKIISDISHLLRRQLLVIDERSERSNIYLNVLRPEDKIQKIEEILDDSGPVIIYFSSKKVCDEVHNRLKTRFRGMTYHADMTYEERMSVQSAFHSDRIHYVCATSAFGMGINKKNIRTVIHYHVPKSTTQYVQEVGRAGRDGESAQAILLFDEDDISRSYRFLQEDHLSETDLDLYLKGAQLAEDKTEQLRILTSLFTESQLRIILQREFRTKVNALNHMAVYGQVDRCLSGQLYHLSVYCQHCQYCKGQQFMYFDKAVVDRKTDDRIEYIKSLFNQG